MLTASAASDTRPELVRLVQAASNAIHASNEGLDPDLDALLVSALTDLVQWISKDTQETLAREATAQYNFRFERLLATTCSEVMTLLLAIMPSKLRFLTLTEQLFQSIGNMGPLAYTEEGNAILKADMTNAKDTMPLPKPHARVGHHSSVLRVKLRGHGRMLPFQHQAPGMKKLGHSLGKLAEYHSVFDVNEVADKVMQLLCDLLGERRGFVQGVPYGVPSLHGHGETIGTTLEEMARFCRGRRGAPPHSARDYLFKMAEMVESLLDNMNYSGSKEFESTRTVVQMICVYCWFGSCCVF
jgi:hypothetical protein